MLAIKARFDGKEIILPPSIPDVSPGEVVVVFEAAEAGPEDIRDWMKVQESAFAKVWENDEDSVYDSL